MFCPNCGNQIEDGARFCPSCGAQTDAAPQAAQPQYQQPQESYQHQQEPYQYQQTGYPQAQGGATQGKMSIRTASLLCYWFSFIGWLISYLASDNTDPYLRFHLNQSLILWIGGVIAGVLTRMRVLSFVGDLLGLAIFVIWVIAFVGACKGEAKTAPLLDKIPPLLK